MAIDIQNFNTMHSVSDNDALLVAPNAGGNGKVALSVLKSSVVTVDGEQTTSASDVNAASAVMVKLSNSGVVAYPATRTTAVVNSEGLNVEQAISAALLTLQKNKYAANGATYDEATGTWSMHKVGSEFLVTGLSAADMEKICAGPDINSAGTLVGAYSNIAAQRCKTNRPVNTYRYIQGSAYPVSMNSMANGNSALEVFYSGYNGANMFYVNNMRNAFANCTALRVVKYLNVSQCTDFTTAFLNCTKLQELYLQGLNANLDLSKCSALSQDSLIYLVEQAGTSTKTLLFRSTLCTNWQATEDYPTYDDFATYASTKKGFTFGFEDGVQKLNLDWEQ